ncbi:MAG TPA: carboxypeptidase regulatory-like domain-containing protein [Thermoanaerobaculia bacterium]|nr:carboxypeptidase regulatory-like domain-containing protein [Thermoanaerobaculia bacterium]
MILSSAAHVRAQIIPTATVTGTVTDGFTGLPVAGATVSYAGKTAITNAAGTYTITVIACSFSGPFTVTAVNYQQFSQTYAPPVCGVNMKNVALAPLTNFSGTVTDARNASPIAGALVSWGSYSTTTDASGNYAFTNVLCGTANLNVSKANYFPSSQPYGTLCRTNQTKNVALTPSANITGTVRDSYGNFPIFNALVTFQGVSDTTDSLGRYFISGLPCGAGTLSATAASYQSFSTPFSPTCAGSDVKDIQLQPLTDFSGTVTDSVSGAAIAGATVTWASYTTATDSTGRYRLFNVLCQTATLTVSKSGYQNSSQSYTPDCYPPPTGGPPKNVQLRPLVTVNGTVKDVQTGFAISGATVTWGTNSTTTGQLGGYAFTNVICQTATLTAAKTGYQTSTQTYTPTCLITNTKDIQLQGLTSFSGVVRDAATSAPIVGATISWGTLNTTTSQTGTYAFANVPCGTSTLKVTKSGYVPFSQSYTPTCLSTSAKDITLSAAVTTGTILGTIRDAVSNSAINGAAVDFAGIVATTDSSGKYSLANVPCVADTLAATANGYQNYSSPYTPATCPGSSTKDIQLQPNAVSFSGIVADAANRSPVAGASVTWGSFSTTTNVIGAYAFNNVACQTATLTITKSGYQTFSQSYTPSCFGNSIKDVPLASASTATCTVSMSAPAVSQSGIEYVVSWTASANPNTPYTLDEATSRDFTTGLITQTVSGLSRIFTHDVTATTTYYYRAKPLTCTGTPITFSSTISTVVQSPPPPQRRNVDTVVPLGSTTPVRASIFIPAPAGKNALDTGFTASTDQPYLAVSPSSGTIPPQGMTFTVTASPAGLPVGANTGTVNVVSTLGEKVGSVPVSITLSTSVTNEPKNFPPQNALIIPVVTHVNGATGPFLSDVRLTNMHGIAVNYELTFTPTGTNGTQAGKKTTIAANSTQTIALNDIARDFFGLGASGNASDFGFGALEIRPVNVATLLTFASSRTYASAAQGTFGQFIAAIPFSRFATRLLSSAGTTPVLSLQQVAESAKFRTNLGIVEGAGQPVNGRLRIFNDLGVLLKEIPYNLQPAEHRQMNRFISANGVANLEDGRIEITVDSDTGAISAYASVLDNITSDPLAVMPVQVSGVSASSYTLPGIADLPTGANNFHSDIRIYNGGNISVPVTLTFYPQSNPGAKVAIPAFTIGSAQVAAIDNVLPALFGATPPGGRAGSIVVTTVESASLVVTGRTYSIDSAGGTFGQFIPGVTPAEGIAVGSPPLQLLQLEQSQSFRTNLGMAELSGNPAHVRINVIRPESKVAGIVEWDLRPNEFVQLGRIIESVYGSGSNTYNARISVEVTGGTGRVAAYGSVIDNATQDPTYVPAQ